MTTPTYATNAQIDEAVLDIITRNEISPNAVIGSWLMRRLKLKPISTNPNDSRIWIAQEHANRSCQRLKQRGLVKFDKGWRVA